MAALGVCNEVHAGIVPIFNRISAVDRVAQLVCAEVLLSNFSIQEQ